MFPILPSPGMQVEAHREQYASANEEEYAQKYGRVLRLSGLRGRASRARMIVIAAVIITLAVVAFGV